MSLSDANPLAQPSPLPYHLPDFRAITTSHLREALDAGMEEERALWDEIAADPEIATVENTLVRLETGGRPLDRSSAVMFTLVEAVGGDEYDALEAEFMPKLSAHSDALYLNEAIYRRLTSLDSSRALLDLDAETGWLLSEYIRHFREAGVQLGEEDRETLKGLNQEISAAETEFSKRSTHAMTDAAILFEDTAPLAGLDAATLETMAAAAAERGRSGYALTFISPTQQVLLSSLDDPSTRRAVLEVSRSRGWGDDASTDTRALVLRLARLRAERAELLGFPSHAAAVAAEGTAKSADAVAGRLASLAGPTARNVEREAGGLAALKAETDAAPFEPSDWVYYQDRQRVRQFQVDDGVLRPYLELGAVIERGIFFAAGRLYGVRFEERPDLHGYTDDVRVWEVFEEDGTPLALFVGDFYARPGKRGGAWMHNLVEQSDLLGTRPVVMNTANFTRPAPGRPTLLTWDEVETVFHEFGHALHGLLTRAHYPTLSGTEVPRDFVEFPSQVNEMWMFNREVLANFARHHETGEPIPEELLERLLGIRSFGQGFSTGEYLAAALLDQAWHRLSAAEAAELESRGADAVAPFEADALARAGLSNPLLPPRYRTTYFNHAFGGGYDANYYSYIWSETLDADTVEWFLHEGARTGEDGRSDGGLNREAGEHFRRTLLGRGNTRDPLESFREFRGRDAVIEPLLQRRGLT